MSRSATTVGFFASSEHSPRMAARERGTAGLRLRSGAGKTPGLSTSTQLLKISRLLPVAVVAGAVTLSPTAHADEPTGTPTQYRPDELPPSSARWSALLAGTAVLAGSYGIGFGTSYMWPSAPTAPDLRLPVVGPWMALANAGCGDNESGCETVTVVIRSLLATLSGLGQAGGVFLMSEALFLPTAGKPVRSAGYPVAPNTSLNRALILPETTGGAALAEPPAWSSQPLMVAPLATDRDVGLSISGSF